MTQPPTQPASSPPSSAEAPRYCRGCGYDLRALTEPRCPECGRGFDPAGPRSTLRRPPRRWTRWLWRAGYGLLALVLLLAAVWGWFYWGWYEEQQALVRLRAISHVDEPLAPWLQERLGSGGFVLDRVRWVDVGHYTDPREFGAVTRLTRLEGLWLNGAPVRDLGPLARLPQLRDLLIECTPVTDLRPLGEVPQLEGLEILSLAPLDVKPLARCKALRQLTLRGFTATEADVEALQRALPDCTIELK